MSSTPYYDVKRLVVDLRTLSDLMESDTGSAIEQRERILKHIPTLSVADFAKYPIRENDFVIVKDIVKRAKELGILPSVIHCRRSYKHAKSSQLTPIALAANRIYDDVSETNYKIIKVLLENGADPNYRIVITKTVDPEKAHARATKKYTRKLPPCSLWLTILVCMEV